MRIFSIIALIMFLTTEVYGQECKYTENDFEVFTHKKIIETQPYRVWKDFLSGYYIKVQACIKDTTKYLKIRIISNIDVMIDKNSSMTITFEDSSTLELKSMNSITPNLADVAGVAFVSYHLSDVDIKKLLTLPVQRVKIETKIGYIGKQVRQRNRYSFRSAIKCIQ